MKVKVTVNSVAVTTTKFLFCLCDCTVDSDVSTGYFPLLLGILHVCEHAHVQSHVSPGMYCSALPSRRLCPSDIHLFPKNY